LQEGGGMANFNTHLAVGAVASGLAATAAMASGVVSQEHLLTLTLAGTVGSILPDVDLEKAIPSRMLFGALGVAFAFVTLFNLRKQYSIAELWLIWLAVFGAIRYGVFYVFHQRTRHRGIYHSLLAGALFASLTAILFQHAFGETPLISWFAGLFLLFGYIVHLTLDEIYSVDIEGAHLKRSFGTALKLFDYHSLRHSLAMGLLLAAVLMAAPPLDGVAQRARSQIWTDFSKKLWPKGQWFEARMAQANALPQPAIVAPASAKEPQRAEPR
jgi:hypothetical protein